MLVVVVGEDSTDTPRLREALLQAHVDWVLGVMDRVRVAGPIRDARDRNCASLYVLEADGEADARTLLSGGRYFAGGVWQSVSFGPSVTAAGTWTGGASRLR